VRCATSTLHGTVLYARYTVTTCVWQRGGSHARTRIAPPPPIVQVAEKEREVSAVATPVDRDSQSRDTRAWRSIPATDVQPLRYEATRFSTYREGTWCESGTARRGMKEAPQGPSLTLSPMSSASVPPVPVVKVSGGSSSPPIPQRKTPPPLARDIIRPGSPVFTFAVQPGPRKQKKNSPRGRRHPPPPQSQLHARSSASQLPCTLSSPSHRKEKRIPVAFAHHTPPSPPAMPSVIREWHFEKKKQGKRPQWPISIVLLEGGG